MYIIELPFTFAVAASFLAALNRDNFEVAFDLDSGQWKMAKQSDNPRNIANTYYRHITMLRHHSNKHGQHLTAPDSNTTST